VDKREIARENQAKIKVDVEKLYELVGELREQVQKSDVTSTLSVSVVNKAKQIEKLAKQVKDRAKG
jgi:spore coat polysaccharide biosynthesis protein SpsF (cytidylyltransferase family)